VPDALLEDTGCLALGKTRSTLHSDNWHTCLFISLKNGDKAALVTDDEIFRIEKTVQEGIYSLYQWRSSIKYSRSNTLSAAMG